MKRKRLPQLFRRSDLDFTYYDFFEDIWETNDISADPSGWVDTQTDASELLPGIDVDNSALGRYYLDEGQTLGYLKEAILELIGVWDRRSFKWEEVTIYNSVSTANAAVLIALKRLGVKTIIFETPAYGVTINQAKLAGYKVILSPTYYENSFEANISDDLISDSSPTVIWLTQPRMCLGSNQKPELIERLYGKLSKDDFLVIDEATEQYHPTVLAHLSEITEFPRIIKIRGLLKPLGLNGLRLSYVLHSSELREDLEGVQDVIGGSLDLYSLLAAAKLAEDTDHFFTMLSVANRQVTALRKKAEIISMGSDVEVSRLTNGYMGSAFVRLKGGRKQYLKNRNKLLEHCRLNRMPVILGSSMYYAFDPDWEQIRFNYFSYERHIIKAMETLISFAC